MKLSFIEFRLIEEARETGALKFEFKLMHSMDSIMSNNKKKRAVHAKREKANDLERIVAEGDEPKKSKNELYLFSCDVLDFKNVLLSTKQNHLDTFVVIGQSGITSLQGISRLVSLRELWVVECLVEDLSDLEKCKKLERLYLYSNNVKEIPDLSNSVELKLVSLSGNDISQLKNLHTMPKLREFYVANNKIKRIGDAFYKNSDLASINFAGNPLYRQEDIRGFFGLKTLRSIVFTDSMYGGCPLVSMSNYRYFVINCLKNLNQLDYYPISNEERSHSVEFFRSKLTFYNMLSNKYLDDLKKSCEERARKNWKRTRDYREEIYSTQLKQLRASNAVGGRSPDLQSYEILQKINRRIEDDDAEDQRCAENYAIHFQILQRQLSLNFRYCGNIRFTDYLPSPENSLVKICEYMCNESLCRTMRQNLGITKVLVHRVTKSVNNETNALRASRYFNDDENPDQKGSDFIFKFLVKPVGVVELQKWPFEIFQEEFFDAKEILTSDCLAAADADWLKKISSDERFPQITPNSCDKRRVAVLLQLPNSALTRGVEKPDDYHTMHPDYDKDTCQCSYVVEPKHVKPVFAVEYEYIFQNGTEKEKGESMRASCTKEASVDPFNTWACLTSENLPRCLNSVDTEIQKLVVIDVSGRGIRTIDLATPLPNLRELLLSYNELTALPDLTMVKYVRKLDVSFNDISSFEITTRLPSIESLNFAWNRITRLLTILQTLETFTPSLTTLGLKRNLFADVTEAESIFLLARSFIPNLKYLDENLVEDFPSARPVGPCLWKIDIFEKTDSAKLEITAASVISEADKSPTAPLRAFGTELETVRYVNLSGNRLRGFEFVAELPRLRKIDLSNNLLTKVRLEKPLNHLTKLNLRDNFILTTDGLTQENLPVVDYIDLSNNLITSLVSMGSFHSLTEFYSSHNEIGELSQVYNLKNWSGLKIISVLNNPVDSMDLCDKFMIFHIAKIEYVNGRCVTAADISDANQAFGGFLDKDRILKMYNLGDLSRLRKLSLVNCAIKKVDLPPELLPNLESLDLSQNQITTLWDFGTLKKLKVLCLSRNQVETSVPIDRKNLKGCLSFTVHTLFLDQNGIRSLIDLNLQNMPSLKHLYLQRNYLKDVNGLKKCANLETLVLDRNKIHIITEEDFHADNNIKALFLENNKMKFLSFAKRLLKMKKLFISNNKVTDKGQLKYLEELENLREITILGNPFCKKTNHYKLALQAVSNLTRIDGHSVILNEYL